VEEINWREVKQDARIRRRGKSSPSLPCWWWTTISLQRTTSLQRLQNCKKQL